MRRRLWLISPEGFRELRHSCLLSRKAAAEYLGVCLRTLRHWEAGRNRVPWSAVRLLRLMRAGELGGLDDAWEGWTINRHGLRSPCGRLYTVQNLRHWWLVIEQARFWRAGYDLATLPSAAQPREGSGTTVPFPRVMVGRGEGRTRETEPDAIRQERTLPAKPAFALPPHVEESPLRPLGSGFAAHWPEGALVAIAGGRSVEAGERACSEGAEMAQCNGVESASGCALPRDVSLLSDCTADPPQTQAQSYVAVLPLHARECVQGPTSNTGLASNPESGR